MLSVNVMATVKKILCLQQALMLRKKVYMPTREIVSGHPNRKYYCVKIDA
jgi:hypothetical protein